VIGRSAAADTPLVRLVLLLPSSRLRWPPWRLPSQSPRLQEPRTARLLPLEELLPVWLQDAELVPVLRRTRRSSSTGGKSRRNWAPRIFQRSSSLENTTSFVVFQHQMPECWGMPFLDAGGRRHSIRTHPGQCHMGMCADQRKACLRAEAQSCAGCAATSTPRFNFRLAFAS